MEEERVMRLILLLITLVMLVSCTTLERSRSAEVGGTSLVYVQRGEGPATIVLEAGLGDDMTSWRPILEPLASQAKVFAYNRAGYRPSRRSKRPRTPDGIVDDLRELLAHTGNRPPYVLVGHSLGGLYMLRFVERYPEEVAGVVLIDGHHPLTTQTCLERQLSGCRLPSAMRLLLPSHVKQEYDAAQHGRMPAVVGDIPLAVLSRSSDRGGESEPRMALWSEMQLDLSELSTRSRYRVIEKAGHYVHKDQPEAVLEAVAWVMSQSGRDKIAD
jgi:pimeloyl-ACP methyl ester carboxylesterase